MIVSVLDVPIHNGPDVTIDDADQLLGLLSEEELEIAARTSYEYTKDSSKKINRMGSARSLALKYLESARNDKAYALTKLRKTLSYRQNTEVELLREALVDPDSCYHVQLKKELSMKHLYVSGYDREGRSSYIFVPRNVEHYDPEWTVRAHVWTLERAIACSKAQDRTVNAFVDFNGFSTIRHAPPTAIGQDLMTTLRSHYVGYVNQIFLIDAPVAFLCLWAIFKPFAGRLTRDKIHFVSTDQQKESLVGHWYSTDQAAPWMLPKGKKKREFDLEEYLFETPFDRSFDE